MEYEEEEEESRSVSPNNEDIERLIGNILVSPQVERRVDDRPDSPENEPEPGRDSETFDRTLPGQHYYLGCEREVSGRTILDENEIISLPLLSIGG